MKHPLAWALGGFALFGFLRRRREVSPLPVEAGPDPRAEELRAKLAEARAIVDDRDEFQAAEVPIDLAEPLAEDPESRRRAVHESARETVERMRRSR